MALLHLFEPTTIDWFGFYPHKIVDGEWWRLIIGQLLHTNTNHLLLNSGGVLLVWALHGEYYSAKHYLVVVSITALMIGIGLLFFADYGHYAGLSGVLHALFIYGAVTDIKNEEKTGWLLLAGLSIKVTYELIVGPSADTEKLIGAAVAAEAHLLGLIAGAIVSLHLLYRKTSMREEKRLL